MSIILAIETTTELASCALLRDAEVITRQSNGVQTHSHAVLPMVQSLLAEAGLTLRQCDAIAFGAGPGSFTGVRTACGVTQGLAFGAGLPVLPVVTLTAMAEAARAGCGVDDVIAVLDARMGEVYWARYRWADGWQTLAAPALAAPAALAAQAGDSDGALWCGNGLSAHPTVFAAQFTAGRARADFMPHALQVARLGQRDFAAGRALAAEAAQPLYLRNKIAFTSAERAEKNAQAAREAAA